MARRFRPVILAQLIAGSIAGTATAQEVAKPDSVKADTIAQPVDETVGLKLGSLPLYLSGYVTSTFTYSFAATGNMLVGRFYDRLRATRWRALKIARAMSRVLGKHDIESEVFFYRLEFRFTKFMGLRSRRGPE